MLCSKDIGLLRPDVGANCRAFVAKCIEAGYPVLVTGTVRDDEYQMQCFRNGRGSKPPATFHSVRAGLAFDICKNVKHHEYDDPAFWKGVSRIGKQMGFSWGGDWKGLVDCPHFQWDAHGTFSGADIRRGKYPPTMPIIKEVAKMETKSIADQVQDKFGLSEATMVFLEAYKWSDALMQKLLGGAK